MNLLHSEDPLVSALNLLHNVKIEAFPDQRIQAGSANRTGKTIICVSSSSHTIDQPPETLTRARYHCATCTVHK